VILHEIRVRDWGPFADEIALEDLSPGLNLLHGPNESGKSTLVTAAARALFDRHFTTAAEITSHRPWDTSLGPRVEVELTTAGRRYRIEKQFLAGACALISERVDGRLERLAEGREAETRIDEILAFERPGRGASRPHHRGLAQVLWVPQGRTTVLTAETDETGKAVKYNQAVQARLRAALGETMDATTSGEIIAKARACFEEHFTATGRPKKGSPLSNLDRQIEDLEAERETCRHELAELEDTAHRVAGARATLDEQESVLADAEMSLETLRTRDREIGDHRRLAAEARHRRDKAKTGWQEVHRRVREIEETRARLESLGKNLEAARTTSEGLAGARKESEEKAAAAEEALSRLMENDDLGRAERELEAKEALVASVRWTARLAELDQQVARSEAEVLKRTRAIAESRGELDKLRSARRDAEKDHTVEDLAARLTAGRKRREIGDATLEANRFRGEESALKIRLAEAELERRHATEALERIRHALRSTEDDETSGRGVSDLAAKETLVELARREARLAEAERRLARAIELGDERRTLRVPDDETLARIREVDSELRAAREAMEAEAIRVHFRPDGEVEGELEHEGASIPYRGRSGADDVWRVTRSLRLHLPGVGTFEVAPGAGGPDEVAAKAARLAERRHDLSPEDTPVLEKRIGEARHMRAQEHELRALVEGLLSGQTPEAEHAEIAEMKARVFADAPHLEDWPPSTDEFATAHRDDEERRARRAEDLTDLRRAYDKGDARLNRARDLETSLREALAASRASLGALERGLTSSKADLPTWSADPLPTPADIASLEREVRQGEDTRRTKIARIDRTIENLENALETARADQTRIEKAHHSLDVERQAAAEARNHLKTSAHFEEFPDLREWTPDPAEISPRLADLDRRRRMRDEETRLTEQARDTARADTEERRTSHAEAAAALVRVDADRTYAADELRKLEHEDGLDDVARRRLMRENLESLDLEQQRVAALEEKDIEEIDVPARETEVKRLRTGLETLREAAHRSDESLRRLQSKGPATRLHDAEERLAVLAARRSSMAAQGEAARLLHDVLDRHRRDSLTAVMAPVVARVKADLERVVSPRYEGLEMDETTLQPRAMRVRRKDQAPEIGELSFGTREQILLLTRLALGEVLAAEERELVVLDDAMVNTDAGRRRALLGRLREAAERLQILVITCHPEHYAALGDEAKTYDLARLRGL
jgi:DNA repair exonuclease SbcCD ATPase subunit